MGEFQIKFYDGKKEMIICNIPFSVWECQKHPQRRGGFIMSFVFEWWVKCRISKNWVRINIFRKKYLIMLHFFSFYLLKLFTTASRAQTEQSMYNFQPIP